MSFCFTAGLASRRLFSVAAFGAQQGKQDHFADCVRVSQQHYEPIDADAFARGWRQAMRKRADVIDVHFLRQFQPTFLHLRTETLLLLEGIVQFRKTIRKLHPRYKKFESLRQRRIIRLLLRKRRNSSRKIIDKGWLHQMRLGHCFEEFSDLLFLRESFHISNRHEPLRTRKYVVTLRDCPWSPSRLEIIRRWNRRCRSRPKLQNGFPHGKPFKMPKVDLVFSKFKLRAPADFLRQPAK